MANQTIKIRKIKVRDKFANRNNYEVRSQVFDSRVKRQRTRKDELRAILKESGYNG